MKPLLIRGMWGLGDNIFQRSFVKQIAKERTVYIETPWPQIYADLEDVHFVKGHRQLRTQLKNMQSLGSNFNWKAIPIIHDTFRIGYNLNGGRGIIEEMAIQFDMPHFKPWLSLPYVKMPWPENPKPIALIRPVTIRSEWLNEARNPLPGYIHQIATELMKTHFVIAVADIAAGETLVGEMPPHHGAYLHGELNADRLLALIGSSDVIIGGVGWIVPAAIAAGKRAFIVLGGQGGHNRPEKITVPWWLHRISWAVPDKFCMCTNMRHKCPKTITTLLPTFQSFLTAGEN